MAAATAPAPDTLEGTIERIVYSNEENHYTVAQLLPDSARRVEPVTIVGNLAALNVGETVRAQGRWVNHPQWGRQFTVERFESVLPRTVVGIKKYLGSGLVKGIGERFADRIVAKFGEKTFEVIDQFSARLREVDGIGPERARRIKEAWTQQQSIREIMIFLQGHGIGSAHAAKIFKQYGANAIAVVRDNPYRLARDITGIGFKTADAIASRLGIASDSIHRLKAGVVHTLEDATGDGHTCLPRDPLLQAAAELLGAEFGPVENALNLLALESELVVEEDRVYLPGLFRAECGAADKVRALLAAPSELPAIALDKALDWVQQQTRIELAAAQQQAVRTALTAKLSVITGGPGVGKTTIINSLVRIVAAKHCRVLLAAPTGRAAKRMSEATGAPAQTIHRLLKFEPREGGFSHNERRPLTGDLIIIDETSMLDIVLAYHLLKAVPNGATVVFVGDVDQLPSVGPGNFLRDLIESGRVPVVRLTEIFRQARHSLIVLNAHRVNRGEMPVTDDVRDPGSEVRDPGSGIRDPESRTATADHDAPVTDHGPQVTDHGSRATDRLSSATSPDFFFIEESDPAKALATIQTLCSERIPKRFGFDPMRDVQVLTPMHKGLCGAENLNRELQAALNPHGAHLERFGRCFRVGDRVMQLRNNYDKDVFNGDLGRVKRLDLIEQELTVEFDAPGAPGTMRDVAYDFSDLDELVPAYAISVHKSQGNEYPAVIVPVLTQHFVLLQRNLLYTAITRGKKLVVLVGSKKALAIAVRNNQTAARYSRLADRLRAPRE